MSKIRAGNLVIRAGVDKLAFEVEGSATNCAIVHHKELPALIDFLNSYVDFQANRRTGFRINLHQLKEQDYRRLEMWVEIAGKRVQVEPLNLSITGVFIESEQFNGQQGANVLVTLGFDGESVTLPSRVVRQDISLTHTAFHFHGVFSDGRLDPPPQLETIFRALQALWLDNNMNSAWSNSELR
ncbi:MAG: PilZ domain-containing protein [Halieaceae bacterium]|jgi:hypothetical protein|nr:PilZ domain-containing protein [Halieaceae bacterium]